MTTVTVESAASVIQHRIWVPRYFFEDHADRSPADDGDDGIATAERIAGNRVLIVGTASQIECLRSDASYYFDRDGPDESPPALKRSAGATLNAIKRQVAT